MSPDQQPGSAGKPIVLILVVLTAIAMKEGLVYNPDWYKLAWVSIPLLAVSLFVFRERKPGTKKKA